MAEKALPGRPPPPPPDDLPPGFGAVWDAEVRRFDAGAVLVGGIPRRVLHLSAPAVAALDGLVEEGPGVGPVMPSGLVRSLLDGGLMHPVPGPAVMGEGEVTVVVPVRDREAALRRLLPSLGPVGRVVVVDDGSTDGSAAAAAACGAEVVRRPQAGGPAAARNSGLAVVRTPLVAFVDSDVRLAPGWLRSLLPHFNDPTVVVVAPRLTGEAAERGDALSRYEVGRSPLDLGPEGGYVRPGNRVSFLPAAVLVARTEVVGKCGGFDEALAVGEDVDLVWRLGAAGWRVRYEPEVVAHHAARPSLRQFLGRRVDYGTSAALLHGRHPGRVAPLRLSPWTAAVWGLALAGLTRTAAALVALTVGRLGRRLQDRVGQPVRVAWTIAGDGHLGAGRLIAAAAARTWLPVALLAFAGPRPLRRRMALLLAVPPLVEWWQRRPPLDPARYALLHLADDAAYCAGVWLGCWRERTGGPLWPQWYRPSALFPPATPPVRQGPGDSIGEAK